MTKDSAIAWSFRIAGSVLFASGLFSGANGQDSTVAKNGLKLSAYAELYFTYDFNKPADHNRPPFVYSHNRHNEVSVNLAYLKGAYAAGRVRANLALAAGTYMNANYAAEPPGLQYLLEANAGVKLSKKHNLWLDAGVMPSHLGFESPVGKDCWTLTRSMAADNSPYYEAGARLAYTSPNQKWFLAGFYLNGWQRIARPPANQTPAWGSQVTWLPSDKITINLSSFVGNDKPDSVKQMRWFHSFYTTWQMNDKWSTTLGLDVGTEQKAPGKTGYNTWYTPQVVLRYQPISKIALATRVEYYSDPNQVIIATGTPNGFQTFGFSANLDWRITANCWWRVEVRTYQGKDDTFVKEGEMVSSNTALTSSLCVSF
jgi:hypothetical protein